MIKKYTLIGLGAYMQPLDDAIDSGWVKYSDHLAELAKLKQTPPATELGSCSGCVYQNRDGRYCYDCSLFYQSKFTPKQAIRECATCECSTWACNDVSKGPLECQQCKVFSNWRPFKQALPTGEEGR